MLNDLLHSHYLNNILTIIFILLMTYIMIKGRMSDVLRENARRSGWMRYADWEKEEISKKLTPPQEGPEIESMIDSLKMDPLIIPWEFIKIKTILEESYKNHSQPSVLRREDLEDFFADEPSHPIHPQQKIAVFRALAERLAESPFNYARRESVRNFLLLNPMFIESLERAVISPFQCEWEIFLAQTWIGEEPLTLKDEIGNIKEFFEHFPSHPLSPSKISELGSVLNAIKSNPYPSHQDWDRLCKIIAEPCWRSKDYRLFSSLITRAFTKSRERVLGFKKSKTPK